MLLLYFTLAINILHANPSSECFSKLKQFNVTFSSFGLNASSLALFSYKVSQLLSVGAFRSQHITILFHYHNHLNTSQPFCNPLCGPIRNRTAFTLPLIALPAYLSRLVYTIPPYIYCSLSEHSHGLQISQWISPSARNDLLLIAITLQS